MPKQRPTTKVEIIVVMRGGEHVRLPIQITGEVAKIQAHDDHGLLLGVIWDDDRRVRIALDGVEP